MIHWHTFHIAYNRLSRLEQKTLDKFNHNWLPLQTSHQVQSTSKQQQCPSCQGHAKNTEHFLICPHPARQQYWVEFQELLQKYHIRNTVPHKLQELLISGLQCSHNSNVPIPHQFNQNPNLAPVIAQQTALRWHQLLHRQTAIAWHQYSQRQAQPTINSYHFGNLCVLKQPTISSYHFCQSCSIWQFFPHWD